MSFRPRERAVGKRPARMRGGTLRRCDAGLGRGARAHRPVRARTTADAAIRPDRPCRRLRRDDAIAPLVFRAIEQLVGGA
ncbi:hypothetical protein EZV77_24315, partial [Burkholderia thailandensis]